MTEPKSIPAAANPVRAAPMGHHAAGGAAWALLQTILSKMLGLASQFVMAYILDQRAVGAALQAFAIMTFPVVIQRFGVTEILVQRQRRFKKLATAGHWLSVTSGFLVALISVVCAVAIGMYKSSHLIPGDTESPWLLSRLVIVCGLGSFVDGFITLPQAKLRIQLEFRRLSLIALFSNIIMGTLTISFLLFGMGSMSLILPRTLSKVYELFATWRAAGVKVRMTPDFARWRFLLNNGVILSLFMLCGSMIQNADNMAVGLFQGEAALGIYGFAFNLSTQSLQLMAISLTQTFFSVFAKLADEPERQVDAFMRSARVLNMIVIPFCLLQAVVSVPLLHFLWGTKWDASAPVLQMLSIGMIFAVIGGGINALFQAQGRFKAQLVWQFVIGVIFCALMAITAIKGNEFTVSVAVCLFYAATYPLGAYLAARPGKVKFRRILSLFFPPILVSMIAGGAVFLALYVGRLLPETIPEMIVRGGNPPVRLVNMLECVVMATGMISLYILIMSRFQKEGSAAVTQYIRMFARRLQKLPVLGTALRYFQLIEE